MSAQSAGHRGRPPLISSVEDTDLSSATEVDIICVHGLDPPRDTFPFTETPIDHDSKSGGDSWLAPRLPLGDFPQDRVEFFSYRYQDLLGDSKGIRDAALQLVQHLSSINTQNVLKTRESRKLVFVCHSLGGLVVKEALIISSDEEDGRTFNENIGVARRTRGIIFLGTPHSTDLERLPSQIDLITLSDSPSGGETIGMDVRAAIWQNLRAFTNLSSLKPPWQITSFYEELALADKPDFGPVVGLKDTYLYNQQQVGIHVNHGDIAKFKDPDSPLYKALEASLKGLLGVASSSYTPRQVSENSKRERLVIRNSRPLADVLKSIYACNGGDGISPGLEGTCSWILSSPIFNDWCAEPDFRVLYIQGDTASGKTTLMKFISDRLKMDRRSGISAAFFFRHTEKPCKTRFLKSILWQILTESSTYPPDLVSCYSDKIEGLGRHGRCWEWSEAELEGYIRQSIHRIAQPGRPFTLILDGVDGCPDEDPICSFVKGILKIPSVRVCISSRPNPLFDTCELLRLRLTLEDHTAGDIQHYTSSKLKSLGISPDTTATIAHRIVEKSKGVFLWAHLVVLNLPPTWCDEETSSHLDHLDHIPTALDQLFQFILDGILDDSETRRAELVTTALRWMLCSLRPLTFREIVEALLPNSSCEAKPLAICESYQIGTEEVRVCSPNTVPRKLSYRTAEKFERFCGGLLKVDMIPEPGLRDMVASPGVHFIHQTVKDFLLRDLPHSRARGGIRGGEGHRLLASSCLGYLSATPIRWKDDGQRSGMKILRPLLEYCVMYLMEHIRLADQYGADCKEFALALTKEDFAERWIILYNAAVDHKTPMFKQGRSSIYHILSYFDLVSNSLGSFVPTFAEANQKDHMGRTPLIMAAAMGTRRAVHWLLRSGADPEIRDEIHGQTPLAWAAGYGRLGVVQDLLDAGAVVDNTKSGYDPIYHAVAHGHADIVRLLLSYGVGVHSPAPGKKPHLLSVAAVTGRKFLVPLLISHGANPLAIDGDGGYTSLHYAILGGRKRTLEQLLRSIPDHQLKDMTKFSHPGGARTWVDRIFMAMILGVRHRGTDSSPTSTHPGKGSGVNRSPENPAPARDAVKRQRDHDGENSDNEDGEERSSPPRKQMRSTGTLRFACPYYKRYPDKYHRGACASPGFPTTHRLIQHLTRSHYRGDSFPRCRRCKHSFPNTEIEAHENQTQACEPRLTATDYEEGFDVVQMGSLTAREMKPKRFSCEADRWVKAFQILFPDWSEEIPSPYHDLVEVCQMQSRICSDKSIRELRGRVQTEDDDGLRRFLSQFVRACAYGAPAASTTSPEPPRDSPPNPGLGSLNANLRDPTTTMNWPLGVTGPGSSMRLGEHSTDRPTGPTPIEQGHISRGTATQTRHLGRANPSFHMQFSVPMNTPDRCTYDWYPPSLGTDVFPGNPTLGAEFDDPIFTNSSTLALSNQDGSFGLSSSQQPEIAEGTDLSSWCPQDEGGNTMVAPAAATNGDEGLVNYQQPNFPSVPQSTMTPQSAQRRPGYEIQSQNQSSPPPQPPPINPQVQQPTGPNLTWRPLQPMPPQGGSERQQPDFRNGGRSSDVNALSALYQRAASQRRHPSRRPNEVSGLGRAQQPDSYPGYF